MCDNYETKRLIKFMRHEVKKKNNCLPYEYDEGYASGYEDAVITMINWIECYEELEEEEKNDRQ